MMASPYLSPPVEYSTYIDDLTTSKPSLLDDTIDPQKLNSASAATDNAIHALDDCTTQQTIKPEPDEDYGFSKFAAERDAARNEDELDEDTKLLMSEEGRKLSSKERRQLRNKVSARNFRERRKEYITHLEQLVSKHQNEANVYKKQVDVLATEKDELASELAKLKLSINAALEANKLTLQQNATSSLNSLSLTRSYSRSGTPSKEASLIPSLTKDINPYSASSSFNVDWPLSNMASPSTAGSFDFNLHNYTSVFSVQSEMPISTLSEKELCGKDRTSLLAAGSEQQQSSECLLEFDRVLSSILGDNWRTVSLDL